MLTSLEKNTLQKLANGMLVKQVADSENVSHTAIDKRIKSIKRKLKAKTLCEAVYVAAKTGLICILITTLTAFEIEIAINPDFTDCDLNRARYSRRIKRKSESNQDL